MENNKKGTKKVNVKKNNTKNKTKKSSTKEKLNTLTNNKTYKEAEKLYKVKDYQEAYILYKEVLKDFKDKKVYKRLIECLTKDYTYKENNSDFKRILNDYLVSYRILINKRETSILDKKLEEYKSVKPEKSKSKFILIFTLGYFGVHKFIEKKYLIGLLYLFTLGFFGLGVIYDLVNDYALYEDDFKLNIVRYIISLIIIIVGLLSINNLNFYLIIIAGILFMPIIYSKVLFLIPNIIKSIVILILIIYGFKTTTIVEGVPGNIIGTWVTTNENTNFKSVKIKDDKSTIIFNDRDNEVGTNEYNNDTKILKVYINATKYYKFIMDSDNKRLCIYNDSKTCNIAFSKVKK